MQKRRRSSISARKDPEQTKFKYGHYRPWSRNVKYLGVQLDTGMFFHLHVQDKKKACLQMAKSLIPFFLSNNLQITTKLRLYKATVLAALLYGSTSWGITSKSQRTSLQVVQNKVLKWILGAPPWEITQDIHEATNMDTLQTAIKKGQ